MVNVFLRNTTSQAGDDLALRRLMLDEKAQLIEMLRLGIFTKEEFNAELTWIEARYQGAARPSPTKCAPLANFDDMENIYIRKN